MNQPNPTALRIGATGLLDGRRYTVRGRVVLSVEVDGETYYWNEFNLVEASGGAATLVYEEEEAGPAWKLFRLFEPLRALSAAEAAARRVGDTVDFGGRIGHVSMVDQSRVVAIEGEAPPGVEVGDVARYFNAQAGDGMVVVSWSGEEVECYEGGPVGARRIEAAFNLPPATTLPVAGFAAGAGGSGWGKFGLGLGVVVLAAIIGLISLSQRRANARPEPPPKQAAAATRLAGGRQGVLAGTAYTLTGHALVEVARPGAKYDRHEYALADAAGRPALLVNGLTGRGNEWHLLLPAAIPPNLTPLEAGALRRGHAVTVTGRPMQVMQLFLSSVLAQDGDSATAGWPRGPQYGLLGRNADDWLLARWTEAELWLYTGKSLGEAEVLAAFPRAQ